ncbi:MAG: fba [Herbinix sp.]|nr:fba [Herbinix sp.]
MALVTTKEMFQKAYAGGYAIGAFNVNNMEIVSKRVECPSYFTGFSRSKKIC